MGKERETCAGLGRKSRTKQLILCARHKTTKTRGNFTTRWNDPFSFVLCPKKEVIGGYSRRQVSSVRRFAWKNGTGKQNAALKCANTRGGREKSTVRVPGPLLQVGGHGRGGRGGTGAPGAVIVANLLLNRHLRPRVDANTGQGPVEHAVQPVGQAGENVAVKQLGAGVSQRVGRAGRPEAVLLLVVGTFARQRVVKAEEVVIICVENHRVTMRLSVGRHIE